MSLEFKNEEKEVAEGLAAMSSEPSFEEQIFHQVGDWLVETRKDNGELVAYICTTKNTAYEASLVRDFTQNVVSIQWNEHNGFIKTTKYVVRMEEDLVETISNVEKALMNSIVNDAMMQRQYLKQNGLICHD